MTALGIQRVAARAIRSTQQAGHLSVVGNRTFGRSERR